MPCTDGGPEREAFENKRHYGTEVSDASLLRAIACEFGHRLEEANLLGGVSHHAKKWYEKHKKNDEEWGHR